MLSFPIPQSLGCASYVARITLARKFINNGTLLGGGIAILLNGWKGLFCTVKKRGFTANKHWYEKLQYVSKCLLFSKPFLIFVP